MGLGIEGVVVEAERAAGTQRKQRIVAHRHAEVAVITGYDAGTKIVKGTFGGTTIDWFNEIATISDGQFSAVVK